MKPSIIKDNIEYYYEGEIVEKAKTYHYLYDYVDYKGKTKKGRQIFKTLKEAERQRLLNSMDTGFIYKQDDGTPFIYHYYYEKNKVKYSRNYRTLEEAMEYRKLRKNCYN